jgi:RNA polymerase-binding transcription factor DksA
MRRRASRANRNLTTAELEKANAVLADLRARLIALSAGDANLLFAYRRKIAKELYYDERSKPLQRKKLKALKRAEQGGNCSECGEPLPNKYAELDRKKCGRWIYAGEYRASPRGLSPETAGR